MAFGHRVAEEKTLALEHAPGKPLVGHTALVGGLRRAGKPTLVDAAAVEAVGVVIVGMEADPLAGMEEAAGHPGGRKPENALAGSQRPVEGGADILRLGQHGGLLRCNGSGHEKHPSRKDD